MGRKALIIRIKILMISIVTDFEFCITDMGLNKEIRTQIYSHIEYWCREIVSIPKELEDVNSLIVRVYPPYSIVPDDIISV
jgi:hypothetical protein